MKEQNLENLLTLYKKIMPKNVILVKNKERYEKSKQAVQQLSDLIWDIDENAKIDVEPDGLTGSSILFSATCNLMIFDNLQKLTEILNVSNTFEICPLTSGKLHIGLTFEEVFLPAPPLVNGKFQVE